jgi:CTP synthase
VGKYTALLDSYKSLNEALVHGGLANKAKVNLRWIDSESFEGDFDTTVLDDIHAILVPGGFGERGTNGKINAIKFARERKIPFFGICFGMQLALIEQARHLCNMPQATSSEFGPSEHAIVGLMTEWVKGNELEQRTSSTDLGGTMRLGAYECVFERGTLAEKIYGADRIQERHRHRYEVNLAYRDKLEAAGVVFAGLSPDGKLTEVIERHDHPWFLAVQYHPELKSKPFAPHPLFASFIEAAVKQSRLV